MSLCVYICVCLCCVSLCVYVRLFVLSLCECDIKLEYQQKTTLCVRPRYTCFVAKNTHQGPSGFKVPRLNMCITTIISSKIAHQMWCNHPLIQVIQNHVYQKIKFQSFWAKNAYFFTFLRLKRICFSSPWSKNNCFSALSKVDLSQNLEYSYIIRVRIVGHIGNQIIPFHISKAYLKALAKAL